MLQEGLNWEHEEDAIQRLKSMLWALEALRIFDDRLSESLESVKEAKDKMLKYLSQVSDTEARSGQDNPQLIECLTSRGTFKMKQLAGLLLSPSSN